MQVLKPGEVVFDEADELYSDVIRARLEQLAATGRDVDEMDILAARLGVEQVPMRNKQGIMKPKRLALLVAVALRIQPPPMLVVRFDNKGVKTTFASYT